MASQQVFGKPPVTALQEYCAKKSIPQPKYDWVDSDDGSFICEVEAASINAHGYGRSKREAKHDAAANVILKMKSTHPDITEIPQAPHESTPTTDMIVTLRDYCIQQNHPLPTIEIIQQAGPAEAPEFTALCTLSTIKRYAVANNKKDARQKAALEVLRLIIDDTKVEQNMQVASMDNKILDLEAERYHKFKTYREYTESKTGEITGILLSERHNYFIKFYDELKRDALDIINTDYPNYKSQALDLLKALKITPKITSMNCVNTVEKCLFIDLNCDYDVVFAGPESKIYKQIIFYFRDML